MIKAEATLEDSSTLYVSEAEGEKWRDYSYHWQRNNELSSPKNIYHLTGDYNL